MRWMLLLVALPLLGCDPCYDTCAAEARALDQCLTDWELSWDDFGAEDELDYRRNCRDDARSEFLSSTDAELDIRNPLCVSRRQALQGSDCAAMQDALLGI